MKQGAGRGRMPSPASSQDTGPPLIDLLSWGDDIGRPVTPPTFVAKSLLAPPPEDPPRRRRSEPSSYSINGLNRSPPHPVQTAGAAKDGGFDLLSELMVPSESPVTGLVTPQNASPFAFTNPFAGAHSPVLVNSSYPPAGNSSAQTLFPQPVSQGGFLDFQKPPNPISSTAFTANLSAAAGSSLPPLGAGLSGSGHEGTPSSSNLPSPIPSMSPQLAQGRPLFKGPDSLSSSNSSLKASQGLSASTPTLSNLGNPSLSRPTSPLNASVNSVASSLDDLALSVVPAASRAPTAGSSPADTSARATSDNWDDLFGDFTTSRAQSSTPATSSHLCRPTLAVSLPEPGEAPLGQIWDILARRESEDALITTDCAQTITPSPPVSRNISMKEVEDTGTYPLEALSALAFSGRKGNAGGPIRRAIELDRPPWLELRPAPLRNSAADQPARALACTDTAVWLAVDGGLRVWDVASATGACISGEGNLAGEEDAAAYTLIPVHGSSRIMCLAVDPGQGVVWSGHSDGKVRSWPANLKNPADGGQRGVTTSLLIWQAHKSAVTALVVTPYGDLWTGSDAGGIRCWPSDACSRAVAQGSRGDHTAPEYLVQASREVKGKVGERGENVHSEVRFLIVERAYCRVWSGGQQSIALWDARTCLLLRVIGPNVEREFSAQPARPASRDVSPKQDRGPRLVGGEDGEDDRGPRAGFSRLPSSKEAKPPSAAFSFLRRSKDAMLRGAAAVASAAGVVPGGDDSRLGALIAVTDGTVWSGHGDGRLVQWDGSGQKLLEVSPGGVPVRCLASVGVRLWVGFADGRVHVLSARTGKRLAFWRAHTSEVVRLAQAGDSVFTLASKGGVRGWSIRSPHPLDGAIRTAMAEKAEKYTRSESLKILAGTWNVNEQKAATASLQAWLSGPASEASIVIVGLQEMEMGAGSLATSLAKETVGMGLQDRGSAQAQWWLKEVGGTLGEANFERVASRQLAGMLIGVWVRRKLLPYVGEVDTGAVPCGFGRALGNKGAVGCRMTVYRRTVCFVNSHLAAHMDAVAKRNADVEHILQRMAFGRFFGTAASAATAVGSAVGMAVGGTVLGVSSAVRAFANRGGKGWPPAGVPATAPGYSWEGEGGESSTSSEESEPQVRPDLTEADLLVWVGDFNYRIELPYEEVLDAIRERKWQWLIAHDQLRREMSSGTAFPAMREGPLSFPPTYKFDKRNPNLMAYDSSEKRRVPAWCDRVLVRDSFDALDEAPPAGARVTSLSRPVKADLVRYDACMSAIDSDHKPVRAFLKVDMAVVDEAHRRHEYGVVLFTNRKVVAFHKEADKVPDTAISDSHVVLEGRQPYVLRLTNQGKEPALFTLGIDPEGENSESGLCSNEWRRGVGFPSWLQIRPAGGIIAPQQSAVMELLYRRKGEEEEEVAVPDRETQQSWWDEDQKDRAVGLLVSVKGPLSVRSKKHKVNVCHGPNAQRRLVADGAKPPPAPAPPPQTLTPQSPPDLLTF